MCIKKIAGKGLLYLLLSICLAACTTLKESPKYQLVDGIYSTKLPAITARKVFVEIREDSILVYPVRKDSGSYAIDSANLVSLVFPGGVLHQTYPTLMFAKNSFDVDLLTTPIKLRPARATVPNQLNAYVNGSVLIGYRVDYFKINYKQALLGNFKRRLTHYGLSLGVLSGFGATGVNPTTTDGQIEQEYDGIVWQNGIALIIGVDTFTFGLGVGTDKLLDTNRDSWIYQNKPWLGVTLGLNLN